MNKQKLIKYIEDDNVIVVYNGGVVDLDGTSGIRGQHPGWTIHFDTLWKDIDYSKIKVYKLVENP